MAPQTNITVLEHPSMGQVHGTRPDQHPDVEQYLGIQYATLANRFARGTPVEKYPVPLQATQTGPLPIADPKNCDDEHLLLQHALPHPEYTFSETECLTLNVTVPPGADARTKAGGAGGQLPVVVFMHGGGFMTGSADWPQWDLATLVERSLKLGSPVIAVGINYRLGLFGFLTSSALRDAGFRPNNGLHDQKLGLRWVQKNISGFGGDPTRVTYFGTSMGAASGFFHLQSPEPLFNQLIALAGSPLLQPIPSEAAEMAYDIVASALGLDKLPPAEQAEALLQVPVDELSAKLSNVPVPIAAVLDGDVVPSKATYAGLAHTGSLESLFPGARWCRTILVGDGQMDGMIMAVTALGHRTDNLAASLKKCLAAVFPGDPSRVTAILDGYRIDESGTETETDTMPVIHFINDIVFAQAAKATAQAWAGAGSRLDTKSFLTHFNMPNPWAGPWQGHATHALDAATLLGNYDEFLSRGQKACSEKMARDLIVLAHGNEPFPPYSGTTTSISDGVSTVYFAGIDSKEDGSRVVNDSELNVTGRRGILDEVAAGQPEVLDKLLEAFGLFVQGPK